MTFPSPLAALTFHHTRRKHCTLTSESASGVPLLIRCRKETAGESGSPIFRGMLCTLTKFDSAFATTVMLATGVLEGKGLQGHRIDGNNMWASRTEQINTFIRTQGARC